MTETRRGRPPAPVNAKIEKLKAQIAEANEKAKELRAAVKDAKADLVTARKELKPFEKAVADSTKQLVKDEIALAKHLEKSEVLKTKMADAKS
jgi:predicted  nucleic acid-binding Zn-ribbon protein